VVLAQKQKYTPLKQERKSKDKLTHLMRILSVTNEAKKTDGEKTASSVSGVGKTEELHVKE